MGKKPFKDFAGFHHLYGGVIILLSSFALAWLIDVWIGRIGGALGVFLILDDLFQHFGYIEKTPCRVLNDWLWQFKWYQKACTWADNLFGKK